MAPVENAIRREEDSDMTEPEALQASVRDIHIRFLDWIGPERGALFRFCRYLTPTVWDAEDLVQETLLRCFVRLGRWGEVRSSVRAYLFRAATNIWLNRRREQVTEKRTIERIELGSKEESPGSSVISESELAEALSAFRHVLSPQEQVAVLLKDVFDFDIAAIALHLTTTEGGAKSALRRGREKLRGVPVEPLPLPATGPEKELVERFARAFNARDVESLVALIHPHARARVVGMVEEEGRDEIIEGSLPHTYRDGYAVSTALDDENLLLIGPRDEDKDAITGLVTVIRLTAVEMLLEDLSYYYFTPEVLNEVGDRLGLPVLTNLYHY